MSKQNLGIVLQQIRYGDSGLIVRIYTESHGLQSFIIKGAFGKKSRLKPAFFQPLNLLIFEANIHPAKDLHYFKEVAIATPFYSFSSDIFKSSIVIFLSELLSRSLKEHIANPALFAFIRNALEWFDLRTEKYADFHLYFMLELSRHLGFYPKTDSYSEGFAFDLLDGEFKPAHIAGPAAISAVDSIHFLNLCNLRLDSFGSVSFSRETRRELLSHLLHYYQLHMPGFGEMQSYNVLIQLL